MSENKVKGEKGLLLVVAVTLLTKGMDLISAESYTKGVVFVVIGVLIFFLREHYKFKRWRIRIGE